MSLVHWGISREQLEEWQRLLEPIAHKDAFTVSEQIYDILYQMENHVPEKKPTAGVPIGLSFSQVKEGETYRFLEAPGIKPFLQKKQVQVVQKKRTKVIAILLEDTMKYPKGTRFNVDPSNLQEVI